MSDEPAGQSGDSDGAALDDAGELPGLLASPDYPSRVQDVQALLPEEIG